jgi:hypothetical protein
MYPSATLCLAQAKHHSDLAANATLDNVRLISTKAAKAWHQEAVFAKQREDRQARTRETALLIVAAKGDTGARSETDAADLIGPTYEARAGHEVDATDEAAAYEMDDAYEDLSQDDAGLSENPDRGIAE